MENESLQTYWWKASEGKLHETIFGIVRYLDQNQNYVQQSNLRHLRLYGNLNVLGLSAYTYSQNQSLNSNFDRITLNVVQSCCDTVTQKIAKNKPKPTFLTQGGDWTLQKKAKLLDKYVQGQFYALDMYKLGVRAFLDAAVFGTGAIKIYADHDEMKICAERVFIDEIMVDNSEAMYGSPRSLYQKKLIPREVLVEQFPEFKDKIMLAKRPEQVQPAHSSLSTCVMVIEAWHLPSSKKAKDGKHVIAIENQTLFTEEWKKDYFPFLFPRWNQRLLGFFGQGLAEQLVGIQIEINKLLRVVQTLMHLVTPHWLIEHGSKVVTAHINNDLGRILKYSGVKPDYHAPDPVSPELLQQIESLYRKAYEVAGVSQLGAQSKKPEGLDSGKALREFNDIEAERFILVGQMYEQMFMEAAKQIIDLTKELHKEDKNFGVMVKGRKAMEMIKWQDVNLDDDKYLMQIFPTSFLSQTPSGRLSDVQELIQAGFIDKANAMRLLDYPDLQEYMSLANAAIEDIENQIEQIIENGEPCLPEPYMDLKLGIQMMQSAYLRSKNDKVPEDRLELLRTWINEANRLLTPPTPTPATQPAIGGVAPGLPQGMPQAVPAAPPVSNLLPNVPAA
jgi:hypothetical protein